MPEFGYTIPNQKDDSGHVPEFLIIITQLLFHHMFQELVP